MKKLILLSLMLMQPAFTSAQENQSTVQTTLDRPKTSFKLKSELRSSTNSFSDRSSVSQFRLRLDPSWAMGEWVLGLRQDLKNKYAGGQDDSWDQQNNRFQKYLLEESIEFNLASNLEIEIGHVIEKPVLANNKADSFVAYDKEFSQIYTAINYDY